MSNSSRAPEMCLGSFPTRLCFVPFESILGLTLRHYTTTSAPSVNCTCSVPSEGQPLGGRLGGQPQGEEAEQETSQVNQEVGSVCDDSKTPSNVAAWGCTVSHGVRIQCPAQGFPTHQGSPTQWEISLERGVGDPCVGHN